MFFTLRSMILIFVLGMIVCGCAGNSSHPVSPDNPDSASELTVRDELDANTTGSGHYLMYSGYIYVDPGHLDGPRIEVIPARQGEIHLNILKLLEIAPCDDCFRIVDFDFPEPDKLNVDILIEHPFDDLDFSVFDVRCIMMFNGSHEFPSSELTFSDPALGDGSVLNPDGYTALYNGSTIDAPAAEFQTYFPGELATWFVPDSDINGFKSFKTDDPSNLCRGFYAGSSDTQTCSLQLPFGTWVFGYAVDASWAVPISSPVEDPQEDFDKNANCTEPWKIVVTKDPESTFLSEIGGEIKLLIEVWDRQGKSTHYAPVIECPEIFDGSLTAIWVSDGANHTNYEVTISNDNLVPAGKYMCLIGVEAIENDPAETPWLDLTGYQIFSLTVVIPGGDLTWVKQAGSSSDNDEGRGIATLSDNSIVVIGFFYDSATFGLGEPNETVLNSAGSGDIFIARYNPDGTLIWAKQAGGDSRDYGNNITLISDNSIVVTGRFRDSATFGLGEINETILNSAGEEDIFIARYDPDGSLVWAKRAGGETWDESWGITTLSDNSNIVTGYFEESATFGLGESNETILNSEGDQDIFIARLNPDGNLAWAVRAGGIEKDRSYSITALSDNSIVITGRFEESAIFGMDESNETILNSKGDADIFIARYNPDGNLAWAKQAGGGARDLGYGTTTLSDNSTVVIGTFGGFYWGTATFGQDEPNETVLISGGHFDIFIAKYNPDGSLAWAKSAGASNTDIGYAITSLSDDSIIVTGYFMGPTIFGQDEPNETGLDSVGEKDIFIAKYNTDGSFIWVKQAGSTFVDIGRSITALSDDSIIVTGWFEDSATFGLSEPSETILISAGKEDIFIARFAP